MFHNSNLCLQYISSSVYNICTLAMDQIYLYYLAIHSSGDIFSPLGMINLTIHELFPQINHRAPLVTMMIAVSLILRTILV